MKLLSVLLVPALAVPSCLKEGTLGKDPFLPAPSCLAFSNLFHIVYYKWENLVRIESLGGKLLGKP